MVANGKSFVNRKEIIDEERRDEERRDNEKKD
jgi:hypothetical protein